MRRKFLLYRLQITRRIDQRSCDSFTWVHIRKYMFCELSYTVVSVYTCSYAKSKYTADQSQSACAAGILK